jgi:glycosyltransferase involved in cell wall biosynthesis
VEKMNPFFSVVVSTIGIEPMDALLKSLETQIFRNFELIVVDQSDLGINTKAIGERFPNYQYIRDEGKGASRGRNIGARRALGSFVFFPDDDCWFDEFLFSDVRAKLENNRGLSFISFYLDDEKNSGALAKLSECSSKITESNIFSTHVESSVFFKRGVFADGFYFNEEYGVGNQTKKKADEGPELLIRLLRAGYVGFYDPSITIRHPSPFEQENKDIQSRGFYYNYARGALIRQMKLSSKELLIPLVKHCIASVLYAVRFDFKKSKYYFLCVWGRVNGYANGK